LLDFLRLHRRTLHFRSQTCQLRFAAQTHVWRGIAKMAE
jgi:hypothetical protein